MDFMKKSVFETIMFMMFSMSLLKLLSSPKMLIMLISLEMSSVFTFYMMCELSTTGGGLSTSLYSIFLSIMVCESVLLMTIMLSIYRIGMNMTNSTFSLKF